MNPRDYQVEAIRGVIRSLPSNPLLVAPTGAGKTFTASRLVRDLGVPTLWVAHRRELIDQAAKSLRRLGLRVGIIRAGDPVDPGAEVQVASIQTLARRECPRVGLAVIDEAHRAKANSYAKVFALGVPVVGLTATPFRLDGRSLGDVFGSIVVAAQVADLVARPGETPNDDRPLWNPEVYSFPSLDLDGVKITRGDFDPKAVAEAIENSSIYGDVVGEWERLAGNTQTVAFAANVQHSKHIVEAFKAAGVAAEHIDGNTPSDVRDGVLARLASGETRVVSNCLILTEGWDLPSLGCVIIARPTASLNIHIQTVGRVMRHAEGKVGALVLDHAGNHLRHGAVTRRLEYDLDREVAGAPGESLGLRRCDGCAFLFSPAAKACPACGLEVSEEMRRQETVVRAVAGRLVRYGDQDFEFRREYFDALKAKAQADGLNGTWVFNQYKDRFGDFPLVIDGEMVDGRDKTRKNKKRVFAHLERIRLAKAYAPGWAANRYREVFGVWPAAGIR